MRVNDAVNIEDLHRLAKKKLPKVMFDYIEGGVEDERGLSRNEAAFPSTGCCRAIWSTCRSATRRRRSSATPFRARSASLRPAGSASTSGAAANCCWPKRRATPTSRTSCRAAATLRWRRRPASRRQHLVPDVCRQGPGGHRRAGRPGARQRARRLGADRRRAGASAARAQHPQRLCQCPQRRRAGIVQTADLDHHRGADPPDGSTTTSRTAAPRPWQLGAARRQRRQHPRGDQFRPHSRPRHRRRPGATSNATANFSRAP